MIADKYSILLLPNHVFILLIPHLTKAPHYFVASPSPTHRTPFSVILERSEGSREWKIFECSRVQSSIDNPKITNTNHHWRRSLSADTVVSGEGEKYLYFFARVGRLLTEQCELFGCQIISTGEKWRISSNYPLLNDLTTFIPELSTFLGDVFHILWVTYHKNPLIFVYNIR